MVEVRSAAYMHPKWKPEKLNRIADIEELRTASLAYINSKMDSLRQRMRTIREGFIELGPTASQLDLQWIKREKLAFFKHYAGILKRLETEDQRNQAIQLIKELCLDNEAEGKRDHLIIVGFLTEEIKDYINAARSGNVEAMNELLDRDLENRKDELSWAGPRDVHFTRAANQVTTATETKTNRYL